MASPSSRVHTVSPAELQVFMEHFEKSKMTNKTSEIAQIAKKALETLSPAEFTPAQWKTYKEIESKLLGPFAVVESFRKQMGIEPEGAETLPKKWQFDHVAFKQLLKPWMDKGEKDVAGAFSKLQPFEQKLLLKAFAHFSKTTVPMRAGSPGLTDHDMIILHILSGKLERLSGSGPSFPIGDVKRESYNIFRQLYRIYKGVTPNAEEIEQSRNANGLLKNWKDAVLDKPLKKLEDESLTYSLESKPLSLIKKWDLYRNGEKRIGGEVRNDFRRLSSALTDLKIRLEKGDRTVQGDIVRYFESCRVAVAKGEAQVDLYKPYLADIDMVFLEAKALADLGELRYLEADALYMMEQNEWVSSLGSSEDSLEVRKIAGDLLADGTRLAERAHLIGHPKGGILLSKLIRLQAGPSLTKEDFDRADAVLENAIAGEDQEALIETGRLHSAAWLYGIKDVEENTALEILEPLGKAGADALREHFEAGSKAAGQALIKLMGKRLEPETIPEKFQRFFQWVVNLFSFGSAAIFGEELFLSKDPHRFSSAEIDFLIKGSLIGLDGASEMIDQAIKEGLGPKIPLEQAKSFLKNLHLDQDVDMVVNGRPAYRYFQFAAETVLASRRAHEEQIEFGEMKLAPYMNNIDRDTYAYDVLRPLLQELIQEEIAFLRVPEPPPRPPVYSPPVTFLPSPPTLAPARPAVPETEEASVWWNMLLQMAGRLVENFVERRSRPVRELKEVQGAPIEEAGTGVPLETTANERLELVVASSATPGSDQIRAIMTVANIQIPVQGNEGEIRILAQIAELLQRPTPERFLGAFRIGAPLIAQLPFSQDEFVRIISNFQTRGVRGVGIARFSLPNVPPATAAVARVEASQEVQGLVERYFQSNASSLVIPAALGVLTGLIVVLSRAGGGGGVSQEVAENLGQILEGARTAGQAVGQGAGAAITQAATAGASREFIATAPGRLGEELLNLIRRNPRAIQEMLRRFLRP